MIILFDVIIAVFVMLDFIIYGKKIKPFAIVAGLYTILINFNNFIAVHVYGFLTVDGVTLMRLLGIFACMFLIEIVFSFVEQKLKYSKLTVYDVCNKVENDNRKYFDESKYLFFINMIFGLCLFAYLVSLITNLRIYGTDIKGKNSGIVGHLSYFAFLLSPVVLLKNWNTKKILNKVFAILSVAMLFIISLIFGGKYVIFINAVYLMLCLLIANKSRINFKKLILLSLAFVVSVFSVFIIIYFVLPLLTNSGSTSISYAITHLFDYLLGPITANNYAFDHPNVGDSLIPFTVPINIFRSLFGGDYVYPVLPFVFNTSVNGNKTNVAGFIGESVYALGYLGGITYILVIFAIINVFYLLFTLKKRYSLTYTYILSVSLFLFFCNFVSVSGVLLPVIYIAIIETAIWIIDICVCKKSKTPREEISLAARKGGQRKLAIIILNWNGTEDTIECLQSLKSVPNYSDVFVLDNNSIEEKYLDLLKYVESGPYTYKVVNDDQFNKDVIDDTRLYLIKSKENLGFAKGNNFVANIISKTYEYVLLLNNDTIVPRYTINNMLNTIKETQDVAITCDIRYNYDRTALWNAGGCFKWYGDRKYYSQKKIDNAINRGVKYIKAEFITGCALMVDTRYIEKFGLFTEQFFHGEEDFNFCKMVAIRGGKIGVDLSSKIYHKVGRSINTAENRRAYNKKILHYTNRVINYKNFYDSFTWKLWRLLYLFLISVKLILSKSPINEVIRLVKAVYANSNKYDCITRVDFLEIINNSVDN